MFIEDIKERGELRWSGNIIMLVFLTRNVTEDLYSARIESMCERNLDVFNYDIEIDLSTAGELYEE